MFKQKSSDDDLKAMCQKFRQAYSQWDESIRTTDMSSYDEAPGGAMESRELRLTWMQCLVRIQEIQPRTVVGAKAKLEVASIWLRPSIVISALVWVPAIAAAASPPHCGLPAPGAIPDRRPGRGAGHTVFAARLCRRRSLASGSPCVATCCAARRCGRRRGQRPRRLAWDACDRRAERGSVHAVPSHTRRTGRCLGSDGRVGAGAARNRSRAATSPISASNTDCRASLSAAAIPGVLCDG